MGYAAKEKDSLCSKSTDYSHQLSIKRNVNVKKILYVIVLSAIIVLNGTAQAQNVGELININAGVNSTNPQVYSGFGAIDPSTLPIAPAEISGGGYYWNQFGVADSPPPGQTSLTVKYSDGTDATGSGPRITGNTKSNNDAIGFVMGDGSSTDPYYLMKGIEGGHYSNTGTIGILNLTAGQYDLYVYSQSTYTPNPLNPASITLSVNNSAPSSASSVTLTPNSGESKFINYTADPSKANYVVFHLNIANTTTELLNFSVTGQAPGDISVGINAIQLYKSGAAPAPEPSTYALMGIGGLMIAFRLRKSIA